MAQRDDPISFMIFVYKQIYIYIPTVRDANLTIERNARTHLNVRITNVFSLRVLDKRKKKEKKEGMISQMR